ncbi:MAG: hypothetical protein ABIM21_04890 [candidate division WOR-3 bacterium]
MLFKRKTIAMILFVLFPIFSATVALSATLIVVPMSGEPETKLVFYGAGFVPGEKIRVILTVDDVPFCFGAAGTDQPFSGGGIVIANTHGAFKLVPIGGIPAAIKQGVYTIEAIGDQGSRATAPLEVLPRTAK